MSLDAPAYTMVPNVVLDQMAEMGDAELRVTLAIVRKIIGYHKDGPEPVSYSQLMKLTGLSRQGVKLGLDQAQKRGIVKREEAGKRNVNRFTLNFSDQSTTLTSQDVDQSTTLTSTSLPTRPDPVYPVDTQKKSEKETTKDNLADEPASVEPVSDFRAMQEETVAVVYGNEKNQFGVAGLLVNWALGHAKKKPWTDFQLGIPFTKIEWSAFLLWYGVKVAKGYDWPGSPQTWSNNARKFRTSPEYGSFMARARKVNEPPESPDAQAQQALMALALDGAA